MICISGYSALMLWRSTRCPELARGRRARVHASSLRHPSAEELAAVDWRALGLDPPGRRVDLMVCSAEERRQNSRFAYRVHSCELPAGALVRIGGSVYATSPELTFMQVAEKLDEVSLARLAFELCGSYALASGSWEVAECERSQVDGSNRWSAGGSRKGREACPFGTGAACRAAESAESGFDRRPPLTTVARLERFLEQPTLKGARGRAVARRALRHVAEGSRSPMETAMAMLLCLPPRMGGYGFPLPRLNKAVAMQRYLRSIPAKRRYVCDLLRVRQPRAPRPHGRPTRADGHPRAQPGDRQADGHLGHPAPALHGRPVRRRRPKARTVHGKADAHPHRGLRMQAADAQGAPAPAARPGTPRRQPGGRPRAMRHRTASADGLVRTRPNERCPCDVT